MSKEDKIESQVEEFKEKYDNDEFYNPLVEYESPARMDTTIKKTRKLLMLMEN